MVRKSVYGVFLIFIIFISYGYAAEKEEVKDEKTKSDDKTISKRGILHFGIHGHPHVHAVSYAPKIPVITKVPTYIKPIVPAVLPAPVIPTTPYHLTHGGATITSYNANYPRVPVFTKTVIPPAYPFLPAIPHHGHGHGLIPHHHHHHGLIPDYHGFDHHHLAGLFPHHHHHHSLYPHHHHHSVFPFDHHHHNSFLPHHHHSLLPHHHHHSGYPHVHVSKPIIPVAVPEIHHPKIPVFFPSKPVFSKPEFINVGNPHSNPTFVPIPVPASPHPNQGISSSSNHNNNHINLYPSTQQPPIQPLQNHHENSQGNWQPIIKPTQPTVTENCITYNYHAALKSTSSSSSNNFPQTNNFVSGHGPSVSQQLALYQQQQHLQNLHDHQNSFPYPAAAETFSQNYEAPSNNGNYHGLSSYQVPLGVQ